MSETTPLRALSPIQLLNDLEKDVVMHSALKQRKIEPVGESDVGRLSAEAVLAQYEAAAKAVEGMGDDVKIRIDRLEKALTEADQDLKLVAETAAAIREKGKLVQVQIEEASTLSKDIKDACAEFRKKVGV